MLIGEYSCNLDVKGRLNFPARLREDLGDRFLIAKGLGEKCLFVYSLTEWQNIENKIEALPFSTATRLQRTFSSSACEVEPDKQGRVVIPANLREYGEIEKEIVVIGASNHCEIWRADAWKAINAELDSGELLAQLDELGF